MAATDPLQTFTAMPIRLRTGHPIVRFGAKSGRQYSIALSELAGAGTRIAGSCRACRARSLLIDSNDFVFHVGTWPGEANIKTRVHCIQPGTEQIGRGRNTQITIGEVSCQRCR